MLLEMREVFRACRTLLLYFLFCAFCAFCASCGYIVERLRAATLRCATSLRFSPRAAPRPREALSTASPVRYWANDLIVGFSKTATSGNSRLNVARSRLYTCTM